MSRAADLSRAGVAVALLAVVPAILIAQAGVRAASLRFSPPFTVVAITTGQLKGAPARLSWSPDGASLYFQTLEGGFGKPDAIRYHYLCSLAGGSVQALPDEPEWASAYWLVKGSQASPDEPPLRIDLKSEQHLERTTSVPRGGDLARGGASGATTADDGVQAAFNSQVVFTNTMLLSGEVVGLFQNSVIVPGLTFGWGPAGSRLIAFAAQKHGRLVVMDEQRRKKIVPGSKDALLPAWSGDGARLAWLQKNGRRTFDLKVVYVSSS